MIYFPQKYVAKQNIKDFPDLLKFLSEILKPNRIFNPKKILLQGNRSLDVGYIEEGLDAVMPQAEDEKIQIKESHLGIHERF